jgi:putative flippase GtrA
MTMILNNPRERTRFMKFAVVGTIGAVVDFGVFNLLSTFLGVNPVLASMISFITAVSSNFTWNRFWTYPDSRSKHLKHQIGQFAIVSTIGLTIRTPIFAWLEGLLGHILETAKLSLPISASVLGHNLALAVSIGIVMIWNFFLNRYWTYNDVE